MKKVFGKNQNRRCCFGLSSPLIFALVSVFLITVPASYTTPLLFTGLYTADVPFGISRDFRSIDNDDDGLSDALEQVLLTRFSPVVLLWTDEANPGGFCEIDGVTWPCNVDWFLERAHMRFHHAGCDDCEVIAHGLPTQDNIVTQEHRKRRDWYYVLCPCCHYDNWEHSWYDFDTNQCFFLQVYNPTHSGSTNPDDWIVYGHVYPNTFNGINIQYWFMYAYNDGWNCHEGEWEHILVELDHTLSVRDVVYYQHDGYDVISPSEVTWYQDNHPVVLSAGGSHASYHSFDECNAQLEPGCSWCTPVEHCENAWYTWNEGKPVGSPGFQGGGVLNVGEKEHPLNGQKFIQYSGRWGEIGETEITSGPRGPAYHDTWFYNQGSLEDMLFLVGQCYTPEMDPVDEIDIQIRNLDTGECWQAETENGYYFLLLQKGTDIVQGDTLQFIARDMNESVNITDHVLTVEDMNTGFLTLDFVLHIHYRDLKSFPFYISQVNTGAMVMKMMLDYLMWNKTIHPEGPSSMYLEQTLYNQYKGSDTVINGSELCRGLNVEIDDRNASPAWSYGYFFAPYASTNMNDALKQICIWLDYPVDYYNNLREVDVPKPGHPNHVPLAVPCYGNYNNWMVIRGIHTNKNAWLPPQQLLVYGFWVNDPKTGGLDENTYVTIPQFLNTYFLLINDPGDFYHQHYLVITDPYQDVNQTYLDTMDFSFIKPAPYWSNKEIVVISLIKNNGIAWALQEWASDKIADTAYDQVHIVLQYDALFGPIFTAATISEKPLYRDNHWEVQFMNKNIIFDVWVNNEGNLLEFSIKDI
ncbi:MAG: hypothetical protein V1726_03970 [Methanobacteriota archaeon]